MVRHAQTLKAVTSANAIDALRGAGAVYDGCVTSKRSLSLLHGERSSLSVGRRGGFLPPPPLLAPRHRPDARLSPAGRTLTCALCRYVIGGFKPGTCFVERIVCSREEENPQVPPALPREKRPRFKPDRVSHEASWSGPALPLSESPVLLSVF